MRFKNALFFCVYIVFLSCDNLQKQHNVLTSPSRKTIYHKSEFYRIKIGKYYGVINEQEQEIIPPIYSNIQYSGQDLIKVYKDGKWGYIDKTGKIITRLKYDFATNFSEGLSAVYIDGKWTFVDTLGREKSKFKYDNILFENELRFSNQLVCVKIDDKYGFVDNLGNEKIKPQYDSARNFSDGIAVVKINNETRFINDKGETVFKLPSKYEVVDDFQNGIVRVYLKKESNDDYINFFETGFMSKKGRLIVPIQYKYVIFDEYEVYKKAHDPSQVSNGVINLCSQKTEKWGLINSVGKNITSFNYDYAGSFSDEVAAIALNNKSVMKWGFVDRTGKEIVHPIYDYYIPFFEDVEDFGIYSMYFRVPFFSDGIAVLRYDNKWGGVNKQGKVVIPFKYKNQFLFIEGKAKIELNNKYGCIDTNNKMILPLEYQDITIIKNGIIVKKNNKYGLVDETGNTIIEPMYDFMSYDRETIYVRHNGKEGVLSRDGKEIINPRFDKIESIPFG